MSFSEDLQQLSIRLVQGLSHAAASRDLTKQVLVNPFISVLGFDVSDPREVRPDYDFGRGETVDYALFKGDTPVMLVEVKTVGEDLSNYDPKLAFLFNAVPEIRYAVLTDGVSYKFFTDMDRKGVMDRLPFLTVYMTSLSPVDIDLMAQFRKGQFKERAPKPPKPADNATPAKRFGARELAHVAAIEDRLKKLLQEPSDELVAHLIEGLTEEQVTGETVVYFRPLVQKAFTEMVREMVSVKANEKVEAILKERAREAEEMAAAAPNTVPFPQKKPAPEPPVDPELESFSIIKRILKAHGKDVTDLNSRDSRLYYGLWSVDGWFIRLNLTSAKKHIITRLPVGVAQSLADDFSVGPSTRGNGRSRVYINSHKDLCKLEGLIVKCYEQVAEA